MKNEVVKTKKYFNTTNSIKRASVARKAMPAWQIKAGNSVYGWTSQFEKVDIIRTGIPSTTIEVISNRINIPVKDFLQILGLPQTTYNKKKRENSMLDKRESEMILLLTELLDFGIEVFNNEEEKFQRWMKKQNISLGGLTPESLFDTTTGIQEVQKCLNRIEHGNFA